MSISDHIVPAAFYCIKSAVDQQRSDIQTSFGTLSKDDQSIIMNHKIYDDLKKCGIDECTKVVQDSVPSKIGEETICTYPKFDPLPMSSEFIHVVTSYLAKSVTFTSFHPWINSKRHLSSTPSYVSEMTPIRAFGTKFIEDLTHFEALHFESWKPENEEEIELLEYFDSVIFHVLEKMAKTFRIRETEFIQAMVLLERIITGQLTEIPFALCKDNLPMALCVTVMLANKMNADAPISNKWWMQTFGINPSHLVNSEIFFLRCLDHSLLVKEEEYTAAYTIIQKLKAQRYGTFMK